MAKGGARFIFSDKTGEGRNRYVLFRRTFELPAAVTSATLNLFADTRYRLLVNGVTIAHGPARFFLDKCEYDTHDISAWLRPGRNVIAIMVNSIGGNTFQSQKSVGGLIAWADIRHASGKLRIRTDKTWKALESPGHIPQTHYLSFALNPAEQLDLRRLPADWADVTFDDSAWPAAVLHADPGHWGDLSPRSIPLLDEREMLPRRRLGAFAARPPRDEQVYSLQATLTGGDSLLSKARLAVHSYIHSARAQKVTLGAWWGEYYLNGQLLEGTKREDLGQRQDLVAELREGWNALYIDGPMNNDWWTLYLGLPSEAGLELSAERRIGSENTFMLAGPWEGDRLRAAEALPKPLARPEDLPAELGPWRPWPRNRSADQPSRERGWKVLTRIDGDAVADSASMSGAASSAASSAGAASLPAPFAPLPVPEPFRVDGADYAARVGPDGTLSLLFDFGTEVLGRPILQFDAAEGTIVDLTYSERLAANGASDVHHRFWLDFAERYIARGGSQRLHTFHPRGFRYLEVLVKGDLNAFRLTHIGMTRANHPVANRGQFACADPVLTEIWKLGRDTQAACMEDAFLDCPWRERGLYSGDFLVQFMTTQAAFGDSALFRRCIELFLLGQGSNGLISGGAHGLPAGRHCDYSAILAQALYAYYARTGDVDFLRQMEARFSKLMAGLQALRTNAQGLLDATDYDPYIDLAYMDRHGVNCPLNCLHQRGFHDAARIFDVLGQADLAAHYRRLAERLAAAIRDGFWDAQRRCFVDRLRGDVPEPTPSVHANALALLYDIASAEQVPGALRYVVDAMASNFRVPQPTQNKDCNVTSYFSFYALGALYKYGKSIEAEQFMRRYWGRMLDEGAWTCWEYLVDTGDSRCHAWSTAPTHYLSTEVLGVHFPESGNRDIVQIRPTPGTLRWAEGTYPHPKGPIHVSWQTKDGQLMLDFTVPKGVQVRRA